jgi:hypothetical protein
VCSLPAASVRGLREIRTHNELAVSVRVDHGSPARCRLLAQRLASGFNHTLDLLVASHLDKPTYHLESSCGGPSVKVEQWSAVAIDPSITRCRKYVISNDTKASPHAKKLEGL